MFSPQDYVFNKNNMVGGYPMKKVAPSSQEGMVGGSAKRFDDLIIPVGLVCSTGPFQEGKSMRKNKVADVVDVELFDKLFESITKMKSKSNTRKKR